jgi:hypothetical protein
MFERVARVHRMIGRDLLHRLGRRPAAMQGAATPASFQAPPPAPASQELPSHQGLFIIGAARSGTTILQNALNDSPDIFLLGEANLHTDPGTPDFAARFNAMHKFWNNQETKSSFCPPVLAADSYWQDYFRVLARHHALVGAKTVINAVRPDSWLEKLYAFHSQNFYSSRYIFTFRDPVATIMSTRDLQVLLVGRTDGLLAIMRGYVDTVSLFVRMVRTLPHVQALCHEDIDRDAFDRLEHWLGVKLPNSHLYYDSDRVLSYSDEGLDGETMRMLGHVRSLYANLRQELGRGITTPQLDQNNNHLNPAHLTPLGYISRQADLIAADLPLVTCAPLSESN